MKGARALVWLVALVAGAHAASFLGAGPCDDDFIVYRYAREWVAGNGLVFNQCERYEGFTVPLWVLVHAAGLLLHIDSVLLSLCLSILACALAALALGEAWRLRFPNALVPVPALLLAATPAFAWHGVTGLGTTCLAALLGLTVLFHEQAERRNKSPLLAACFLAAACLMRQECALFALPFAWLALRRRHWIAGLLPLLSLAGWTLVRLFYYGRLLPITYGVKKLPVAVDLDYGLRYLALSSLECGVGVLLILSWVAAWRAPSSTTDGRRNDTLRLYVSGLTLHTLYVIWVGGDYMPLARFFIPTLPLLLYYGCLPLRPLVSRARLLGPALCALALLGLQWRQLEREQRFGEQRFFEERWSALGRHFAATVPAGSKVALSPIGAFGWYSDLAIVDILGLIHAGSIDVEPDLEITMKGHQRFDPEFVLAARPDFMILANGVLQPDGRPAINPWERRLFQHPRFKQEYVALRMMIPGGQDLLLHKRRDLADPPGTRPWGE